jgi:glycosyltransferase involved in cell wall biosynthesis
MSASDKNRRLAFFMPSMGYGGVERVLLRMASAFADRGYAVDLVVSNLNGPPEEGSFLPHVPKNVRVVDLGTRRVLLSLPGLVAYLKRERPAALYSAMDHCNLIAIWAKLLANVDTRVVVSVHSTESLAADENPAKRLLIRLLLPRFLRHAAGIVAVSKGVADDYARYMRQPRDAVRVVYNPVVGPDVFLRANEEPRHPWYAEKTTPLILSVGRLTRAKNYQTLIRAMTKVHARTGARLVILGDGLERPMLTAEIRRAGLEGVVDLPGFDDNPFAYMKRADVFALSSAWEGFPSVLIEAISLGTPVVSTDCPSGPMEILEGGKWGRLVPVGDPDALAIAIVDTLLDARRGSAVERAGDFSMEKIIPEYADALGVSL